MRRSSNACSEPHSSHRWPTASIIFFALIGRVKKGRRVDIVLFHPYVPRVNCGVINLGLSQCKWKREIFSKATKDQGKKRNLEPMVFE
jgi:hypothetical protein